MKVRIEASFGTGARTRSLGVDAEIMRHPDGFWIESGDVGGLGADQTEAFLRFLSAWLNSRGWSPSLSPGAPCGKIKAAPVGHPPRGARRRAK